MTSIRSSGILRVNALSGCYLISTKLPNGAEIRRSTVSMPSRAVTSFLPQDAALMRRSSSLRVNALSGCYLISTRVLQRKAFCTYDVSMPSRAVTSFLPPYYTVKGIVGYNVCQCPLGLLPHFYVYNYIAVTHHFECQCPLGLLPHFYMEYGFRKLKRTLSVNALSGCYLISTC